MITSVFSMVLLVLLAVDVFIFPAVDCYNPEKYGAIGWSVSFQHSFFNLIINYITFWSYKLGILPVTYHCLSLNAENIFTQ